MKPRYVLDAFLILAVVTLSGLVWSLQSDIETLEEELAKVDARSKPAMAAKTPEARESTNASRRARRFRRPALRATTDAADDDALRPPTTKIPGISEPPLNDLAEAVDDPEVRMKLRDVIAEENQLLREQRWARRQERREERLKENVQTLANETGLDETTRLKLEDLLVVELAEMSDNFRRAREEGTWGDARERAAAIRAETDQEAKVLLGEEAFEAYTKMREDDGPGRRGRNRDRAPAPSR